MRTSRVLVLMVVMVAVVAAPSLSAKVCHPKKLVTCGAAELATPAPAETAVVAPAPAPAAKVEVKIEKAEVPAATQQAWTNMVCGPWIKYCRANTLI